MLLLSFPVILIDEVLKIVGRAQGRGLSAHMNCLWSLMSVVAAAHHAKKIE